jgi:hypothetical protein
MRLSFNNKRNDNPLYALQQSSAPIFLENGEFALIFMIGGTLSFLNVQIGSEPDFLIRMHTP